MTFKQEMLKNIFIALVGILVAIIAFMYRKFDEIATKKEKAFERLKCNIPLFADELIKAIINNVKKSDETLYKKIIEDQAECNKESSKQDMQTIISIKNLLEKGFYMNNTNASEPHIIKLEKIINKYKERKN